MDDRSIEIPNTITEDEEDVDLNNITENTTLRNENYSKVKTQDWKKLCCKALAILIAVIVFLAILMRSWSDYGTYITQHVFPPKVYSISTQCQYETSHGGYKQDFFNAPKCSWLNQVNHEGRLVEYNHTLHYENVDIDYSVLSCELEKPSNWFAQFNARNHLVNISWDDNLVLNYTGNLTRCLELVIWSI